MMQRATLFSVAGFIARERTPAARLILVLFNIIIAKTDSPKCFPIRSNPSNEREKPPSNVVTLHHHRQRHPKRALIFRDAKRFYPPPPARLR